MWTKKLWRISFRTKDGLDEVFSDERRWGCNNPKMNESRTNAARMKRPSDECFSDELTDARSAEKDGAYELGGS